METPDPRHLPTWTGPVADFRRREVRELTPDDSLQRLHHRAADAYAEMMRSISREADDTIMWRQGVVDGLCHALAIMRGSTFSREYATLEENHRGQR